MSEPVMTTQVFANSLVGTYDGSAFNNAAQYVPAAGYFDESNGARQFSIGDTILYHYDATGGTDYQDTIPFQYVGYYSDPNGTQFPVVSLQGQYYLFGQPAGRTSFPVTNAAFTQASESVCYCSGTLIRTANGDVAVEHLSIGDLVLTSSGAHRAICWLGHRVTNCRSHPTPETVMPVRIAANAFGERRPARDLFVSPGHAICVDLLGEVLIPAASLVNGSTVTQIEVDEVTYWHVELESHDILLAENLPAESYLEMGNRTFFGDAKVVSLVANPDAAVLTHADFCRPFFAAGSIVNLVRSRLNERAVTMGWTLADGLISNVHVVADGKIVRPDIDGLAARFVLPADAVDVWLVSSAGVPSQLGVGEDNRSLGLCLKGLSINDGLSDRRDIALDDASLCIGFNDCEDGVRRWTTGRARLPARLWDNCRGSFFLRVDLETAPLPSWVAPAAGMETDCGANVLPMMRKAS